MSRTSCESLVNQTRFWWLLIACTTLYIWNELDIRSVQCCYLSNCFVIIITIHNKRLKHDAWFTAYDPNPILLISKRRRRTTSDDTEPRKYFDLNQSAESAITPKRRPAKPFKWSSKSGMSGDDDLRAIVEDYEYEDVFSSDATSSKVLKKSKKSKKKHKHKDKKKHGDDSKHKHSHHHRHKKHKRKDNDRERKTSKKPKSTNPVTNGGTLTTSDNLLNCSSTSCHSVHSNSSIIQPSTFEYKRTTSSIDKKMILSDSDYIDDDEYFSDRFDENKNESVLLEGHGTGKCGNFKSEDNEHIQSPKHNSHRKTSSKSSQRQSIESKNKKTENLTPLEDGSVITGNGYCNNDVSSLETAIMLYYTRILQLKFFYSQSAISAVEFNIIVRFSQTFSHRDFWLSSACFLYTSCS